jgi:hypothetical protein
MDEWNNRRQWNMKVGRRRQTFQTRANGEKSFTKQNDNIIQYAKNVTELWALTPQYLRSYARNSYPEVYRIPKSNRFWTLQEYYAAFGSNSLTTFRDILSVTSSRIKRFLLGFLDNWSWDRQVVPKRQ